MFLNLLERWKLGDKNTLQPNYISGVAFRLWTRNTRDTGEFWVFPVGYDVKLFTAYQIVKKPQAR
ncbi:MAG: hypothetical protein LBC02_04520 [Planctomycetaceae bacterium]|nr:hypothetical protein [Planctomycetaceae bacterium]